MQLAVSHFNAWAAEPLLAAGADPKALSLDGQSAYSVLAYMLHDRMQPWLPTGERQHRSLVARVAARVAPLAAASASTMPVADAVHALLDKLCISSARGVRDDAEAATAASDGDGDDDEGEGDDDNDG